MITENLNTRYWNGVCVGDRKAMEALYKSLYIDLYNYGIHINADSDIVKDTINDMFLEIWSNRGKCRNVENVKSYLFTYLRRKLYASFKQVKKADLVIKSYAQEASLCEFSYEQSITERETTLELEKKIFVVINKLTSRQKELVQLKYYNNLSVQDIAKQTGISTKTVYNTIVSALRIMETKLLTLLIICSYIQL